MAALQMAMEYYGASMPGFSIPAAEHSTITAWGRDNEQDAMENMLVQYPEGLLACVSDSFDIYKACDEIWGKKLHKKVMERNGTLVVRPDSGYPPDVVVKVLNSLGEKFGYTTNKKGYKVLDPHVRVIQGDGCDFRMIQSVLFTMKMNGWSTDNIAFGMGGALLQKLNRDTQSFAFKCSAVRRSGKWQDVYKQPVGDAGKNSKRGRLVLALAGTEESGQKYVTMEKDKLAQQVKDQLVEVFRDGVITKEYTFDECRKNAWGK
jgi:nicotinamide phosphoribosyltransferase